MSNSFYIICEADLNPGDAACNLNTSPDIVKVMDFIGVGGTSLIGSHVFAGMMALVNQNMAVNHPTLSAQQGNANYVLYPLFASQSGSSCNSSTTPAAGCTFNDITKGNISVPCEAQSFSCSDQLSTGVGIEETNNLAANSFMFTNLPAFGAVAGCRFGDWPGVPSMPTIWSTIGQTK